MTAAGLKLVFDGIWRIIPLDSKGYGDATGRYADLYRLKGCGLEEAASADKTCVHLGCSEGSPHCSDSVRTFPANMLFPPTPCMMVGVQVSCPHDGAAVLEWVYGPGWSSWDHSWVSDEGAGGDVPESGEWKEALEANNMGRPMNVEAMVGKLAEATKLVLEGAAPAAPPDEKAAPAAEGAAELILEGAAPTADPAPAAEGAVLEAEGSLSSP